MKFFYYVELIILTLCIDFLLGVILISLGMYLPAGNWETTLGQVMFEPSVILFSIGVLLLIKPCVRKIMFKENTKSPQTWSYFLLAVGALLFTLTTGGGLLEKCERNHSHRSSTIISQTTDAYKQVEKMYMDFARQMNSQTPIRIDEITTLQSVIFINHTFSIFYKIDAYCSDFSAEEIANSKKTLKVAQRERAKKMFERGNYDIKASDLSELMKATGIKWKFSYRDLNDDPIFDIYLDYTDF